MSIDGHTHYSISTRCKNCGYQDRVNIPIATPINQALCPVCECPSLERGLMAQGFRVTPEEPDA